MHHTRLCHWNKLGMHRSSVAILHGRHIRMQVRSSVRCTVTPGKLVWVLILCFWEAVKFCIWYSDVQGNGTRCWCHLWGVLIVLPTELSHFTLRCHEQETSVWHPWEKLVFFFFQRFNSDIIKRFRPFMPLLEGICCIYCNSFGQVGWYIAFLCFLKSVRVSLLYLLKAGWLSSVAKASPRGDWRRAPYSQSAVLICPPDPDFCSTDSGVSSLNHSKSSPSFILVCVPIISTHISIP